MLVSLCLLPTVFSAIIRKEGDKRELMLMHIGVSRRDMNESHIINTTRHDSKSCSRTFGVWRRENKKEEIQDPTIQEHNIHWCVFIMGLFGKKKKQKDIAMSDTTASFPTTTTPPNQPVELGSIHYVNLTSDGRHGDMDIALQISKETGKPIFCNFVEWSG